MQRFDSPLKNIRIASPCSANWDEMAGDERRRFCGECRLTVYNLSGMTKYDAENILMLSEGRLCVRYFQRGDGTVLTTDCPVGWAKLKHRLSVYATAVFSMLIALVGGLAAVSILRKNIDPVRKVVLPFTPPGDRYVMGNIAMPSPTPTADSNRNRTRLITVKPAH